MATAERLRKIASTTAAPIGAGLLVSSTTCIGQKTTSHTVTRFSSSSAIKTLVRSRRIPPNATTTVSNVGMYNRLQSRWNPLRSNNYYYSTAESTTNTSPSLIQRYESHLQTNPIRTKMATGSVLWGLGDFVAQVVPTVVVMPNRSSDDEGKPMEYDYSRTARAVLFGFALHAPLSHAHYNFLEWMTVKGGFTGLSITVFKTTMEQFVYWSWVSNSLYHAAMGAMQGLTPTQIQNRISDVLWDTQTAQWSFWIPVQLINFRFVPVRHQLNVVLVVSVVWTALLSAWYPPEKEGTIEEDVVANGEGNDGGIVSKGQSVGPSADS